MGSVPGGGDTCQKVSQPPSSEYRSQRDPTGIWEVLQRELSPTSYALVCRLPNAHRLNNCKIPQSPLTEGKSGSIELGSAVALGVTVIFVHSMLLARCFSPNRLAAVTFPKGK
jgi:hypothetical protein